ncbi:MAG: hypothetical protein ABGX00_06705 [Allomuricauda sp.]
MKTAVIYDSDLHFEHKQWQNELEFWEDELKLFNHRLEELVTFHDDKDVLEKLEHYQNEFILHREIIENLLETIEEHEANIAGHSKMGMVSLDVPFVKKHLEIRTNMEDERWIYADLKKEFYQFLTKYWN